MGPEGERYCGIRHGKVRQSLEVGRAGYYDRILVDVTAFREQDWEALKADWEAHDGYKDDPEGRIRHEAWHNSRQIKFQEEFWFNINNFF